MARFLCTVSYEEKGHEVLVEVWLENEAPEGETSREEVEAVLLDLATTGATPEGWTVELVNWSHPRSEKSTLDSAKLEAFSGMIRQSEIKIDDNPPPVPRDDEEEED